MKSTARALLDALRAAGCDCYLHEDGEFICSPPRVAVVWPSDVETAIDELQDGLRAILEIEHVKVEFAKALRELPTGSGADLS